MINRGLWFTWSLNFGKSFSDFYSAVKLNITLGVGGIAYWSSNEELDLTTCEVTYIPLGICGIEHGSSNEEIALTSCEVTYIPIVLVE